MKRAEIGDALRALDRVERSSYPHDQEAIATLRETLEDELLHGKLLGFRSGCRCERCRERAPHGTTGGYNNWGCRCDECTAANRAASQAKASRRRASR